MALIQSDDVMRLGILGSISSEKISMYLKIRHVMVVDRAMVLRDVLWGGQVTWLDHKLLRVKNICGKY